MMSEHFLGWKSLWLRVFMV